jgi:hypothetical protein
MDEIISHRMIAKTPNPEYRNTPEVLFTPLASKGPVKINGVMKNQFFKTRKNGKFNVITEQKEN